MNLMLMNLGLAPIPATPSSPSVVSHLSCSQREAASLRALEMAKRMQAREKTILAMIGSDLRSVGEIAEALKITRETLRKQLHEMEKAGEVRSKLIGSNLWC